MKETNILSDIFEALCTTRTNTHLTWYTSTGSILHQATTIHSNHHNTGLLRLTRPILTLSVNYMDKNNFNIHDGAIGTQHIYISN
jgi:hypothetical protein